MYGIDFGKVKDPCGDCVDDHCTMNCSGRVNVREPRRPESVTAREVLTWIEANKPGPDRAGGANYVAATNVIEKALKEICK